MVHIIGVFRKPILVSLKTRSPIICASSIEVEHGKRWVLSISLTKGSPRKKNGRASWQTPLENEFRSKDFFEKSFGSDATPRNSMKDRGKTSPGGHACRHARYESTHNCIIASSRSSSPLTTARCSRASSRQQLHTCCPHPSFISFPRCFLFTDTT